MTRSKSARQTPSSRMTKCPTADLWLVVWGLRMFLPTNVFASCWCPPLVPTVPTVGAHLTLNRTNCRLFWAPKAFLAPDPGHGHSRNTSHLSEDQSCHNLAMVQRWETSFCCCNHHRHCSWFQLVLLRENWPSAFNGGLWLDCVEIASLYCGSL